MARHDSALQGVMLVALLILFPMTIQLLIHQDESPLWKTVYVEVESEEDNEETEARSESRSRDDVARIATFNIKVFGETKMGKADVMYQDVVNLGKKLRLSQKKIDATIAAHPELQRLDEIMIQLVNQKKSEEAK